MKCSVLSVDARWQILFAHPVFEACVNKLVFLAKSDEKLVSSFALEF